ncbi:ribonuclease H-like domain-containing protein [Mycena rebaudengoi]|nr:ribonuclease H-like domain-containing protein [Mycena rebaudengoi]KAJ7271552.1 ribonuclease H-like domain-containing protein [Mycena rebaudengoi]
MFTGAAGTIPTSYIESGTDIVLENNGDELLNKETRDRSKVENVEHSLSENAVEEVVEPLHEPTYEFTYTDREPIANDWLRHIKIGRIGFDTEACPRTVSLEEQAIAKKGTKADRLQFHRNRFVHEHKIDWAAIGICTVQIAYEGRVLIIDIKRMKAFPTELKRILESERIAKGVVNGKADGKRFFEDFGISVHRLVDVGLMVKFSNPEKHSAFRGGELSLVTCVRSLFGTSLDKSEQLSTWDRKEDLTESQIKYAGLDAQASLEVFQEAAYLLREKELHMGRLIPDDWYTLNFVDGVANRIVVTTTGRLLPWTNMLCPWYADSQFQGYHPN